MPNKYSHALVLSHYEACGLISFPDRDKPRPTNPEPSHSERKTKTKKKAHPSSSAARVPSSPPRTPLPPLPPSPCPSTAHGGHSVPSSSHRSTPSIITEIYAPDQPSLASQHPVTLQSGLEPEGPQISPVTTKGNSLTSETSYPADATPRTSISSVRESTGKKGDGAGNDKPPTSRSSNNHDASKKATSNGNEKEILNQATSREKGASHTDDGSQGVATSPPPVRIIQSPPKPLKAFVDNLKPHSFYYIDGCSTRLLDDDSGTPPILRIPSRPPPGSSGSSSPDDAAPPPISRHRRQIASTSQKSDRRNIWTKPAKTDRDDRATPLTIRDLTPEVTPWEELAEVTSEPGFSVQGEEGQQAPNALSGQSSVKSVTIVVPRGRTDAASEASKKVLRKKISRLRGSSLSFSSGQVGGATKAGTEKLVPRDEKEVRRVAEARESLIWSDSDEEFLAQFENDGYFLR